MSQPEVIIFLIAIATIFWIVWRSSTHGKGKKENDGPGC
jgi:hypothetical protein